MAHVTIALLWLVCIITYSVMFSVHYHVQDYGLCAL